MERWICADCNYRFSSKTFRECPYCGKLNLEREKSAEELLDEVENLLR